MNLNRLDNFPFMFCQMKWVEDESVTMLKNIVLKMQERSPLKYVLIYSLSSLNPKKYDKQQRWSHQDVYKGHQ